MCEEFEYMDGEILKTQPQLDQQLPLDLFDNLPPNLSDTKASSMFPWHNVVKHWPKILNKTT